MDDAYGALAEPRRREILRFLAAGEQTAGAIASRFPDVSRSAISQHVRVLARAGLVAERRFGTKRLYRARRERLDALREELDDLGR
ncbi:MAG: helix-turn-helix transcriptional regulator [Chloroflexi bacterium]|nr:helix-turn-helix transcriptional regulator [Chloroflexota bacterium]